MDKRKILQNYLGSYLTKPSKFVRSGLKDISCLNSSVIKVKQSHMNEIITYLLIKDGRQSYRVLLSSEVIDIFLGHYEAYPNLSQVDVKVLIIKILKNEIPNIRRWEICYQLLTIRLGLNLPTTFLVEGLTDIPDFFKIRGVKHIDLLHLRKDNNKDDNF